MRGSLLTGLNGHVVSGRAREHSKKSVVRIGQLRDSDVDDDSGDGGDDGDGGGEEEVEDDEEDDDVDVNAGTNRAHERHECNEITELRAHLGAR